MPRGRPSYSLVRERVACMLFVAGRLTAYDAHKHYIFLFGKTTRRNVYYQLRKGVDKGEFKVADVVNELGDYSWGATSRKVYYSLDKKEVDLIKEVKDYFDNLKKV